MIMLSLGPQAAAQDGDPLWQEFDGRVLTVEEKRLLQVGLTAGGHYQGLIDGKWGEGSQAAFESYVLANDIAADDGLVHDWQMAVLGLEATAFVAEHGLAYRGGSPYGHLLLAPDGAFVVDPSTDVADLVLSAEGLEIRTLRSEVELAIELHHAFEADIPAWQEPYIVRLDTRWVTARGSGGPLFYVRSDYSPEADSFFTTIVADQGGAGLALYRVVVGSIDETAPPASAPRAGRSSGRWRRSRWRWRSPEPAEPEPPVVPSAAPVPGTEAPGRDEDRHRLLCRQQRPGDRGARDQRLRRGRPDRRHAAHARRPASDARPRARRARRPGRAPGSRSARQRGRGLRAADRGARLPLLRAVRHGAAHDRR